MNFLLLFACTPQNENTTVVTNGTGFFGQPWPSDLRVVDGRPDMQLWDHQGENPLLDSFIEETKTLYGFGTNSPIYFQLQSVPSLQLLPEEINSLDPYSNIHIIDVDPNSPYRGERFPIRWDFQEEKTRWQPENLLAIAPTWGYPLRPNTKYAVVLTTELVNYSGDFPGVWEKGHTLYSHYESLADTWLQQGFDLYQIGFATVFTTQNPLFDLMNIANRIDNDISSPPIDQNLIWKKEGNGCQYYDGGILIPLWQFGNKPYSTSGGYFGYDQEGRPIVAEWEYVKIRVSIPDDPQPEEGWPVTIYSHGTGGAYLSFANDSGEFEPATQITRAGMVGIGISQPLHADRGTGASPELYSFNYLNPPSARSTFRQGAADQIYLSKVLTSAVTQLTTDLGEEIILNPNQVHYLGHSHGGEVGGLALPFMGKYLRSAILSGAGGALSITLMERETGTEGLDLEELIENALVIEDNEIISEFHPAIGLVQMLAEVTDPINYARYWFQDKGYWQQEPISILMTEGLNDEYTPPKSIEILAAAAGIPTIGEIHNSNIAQQILGYQEVSYANKNQISYNGNQITAGLVQFPEDGHFPIFQNQQAVDLYRTFLETSNSDTGPEIIP
jgi:hypothetical protein